MSTAENGVLEVLAEGRDAKVNFSGRRLVQERREFSNLFETIIQKAIYCLLQHRETYM